MLKVRQDAMLIQEAMLPVINYAKEKKQLDYSPKYQIPAIVDVMESFHRIDFLNYRGISVEVLHTKLDKRLYKGGEYYHIDADNIAMKDIEEWEFIIDKCVSKIKKILEPYMTQVPFYQGYW